MQLLFDISSCFNKHVVVTRVLESVHCPVFCKTENAMFWELDVFLSSGEGETLDDGQISRNPTVLVLCIIIK
jgi:hypothetical protein